MSACGGDESSTTGGGGGSGQDASVAPGSGRGGASGGETADGGTGPASGGQAAGPTSGGAGAGGAGAGGAGGCAPTNGGLERCDDVDNDCNGKVDDVPVVLPAGGSAALGDACDGDDADLCEGGTWICPTVGATPVCSDDGTATSEICNGEDDDCNGLVDDLPGVGAPCDDDAYASPTAGACAGGTLECDVIGKVLTCVGDTPDYEVCGDRFQDGNDDDDCDGVADADETTFYECVPAGDGGAGIEVCTVVPACTGCSGDVATTAAPTCVAGVLTCPLSEPTYWYLDDDGDGYVQPPSGVTGEGSILKPFIHQTSCAAPAGVNLGGSGRWIQSRFDWSDPAGRSADPIFQAMGGFDCCDAADVARPGQTLGYDVVNTCGNFDYDCDGQITKIVPDGSAVTNPNQCANNCNHVEGWDTLYGCPQQCGQEGHWIHSWSVCTVTGWDPYKQRCR